MLRSSSKLSLAPMMEYTDRHFRHLVRLISQKTLLYTEMVAANAISAAAAAAIPHSGTDQAENNGGVLRFLTQGHRPEGPSVLQLGGSDIDQLHGTARTVRALHQQQQRQSCEYNNDDHYLCGEQHHQECGERGGIFKGGQRRRGGDAIPQNVYCTYTALNLNCGCPSSKVAGKGCFGVALMSDPDHVRSLTTALHEGCGGSMPISVKCRIGTDDWMQHERGHNNHGNGGFTLEAYTSKRSMEEEYAELRTFIETVAGGGVVTDFQIHARIAVLSKEYSPSDNRKVPPLRYDHVRRLAYDYPELNFSLNGGVETLSGVKRELELCDRLDGVMVGRGYVADPWSFVTADKLLYPNLENGGASSSSDSIGGWPRNRMEVLERYGHHADYEEARWGASYVRRYVLRAITNLFAGEHNAKHYRIALDEIVASIPSSRRARRSGLLDDVGAGTAAMEGGAPLSDLILRAATTHLSEEVLYRSPEESYQRVVYEEEQAELKKNVVTTVLLGGVEKSTNDKIQGSSLVREWQTSRKNEERIERSRSEELEITKDVGLKTNMLGTE